MFVSLEEGICRMEDVKDRREEGKEGKRDGEEVQEEC